MTPRPRTLALAPDALAAGPPHRPAVRAGLRALGPWLAVLVLATSFAVADPRFATLANLRVILDGAAVPLVLAIGMTFVIRQGSLDLSVEGLMAACSLAFALAVANDRTPFDLGWLGLAVAAALGAGFGLVNGLVVTRLRVPSFMATLGIGSIGLGVAMLLSGDQPPLVRDAALRQWALGRTLGLPNLALAAAACLAGGVFIEQFTRCGRYSYVVGGAEEVARTTGLNVDLYKLIVFAFAGFMAGLAAAMESARLGIGHVEIGAGQLLAAITAVVIGGASLGGGSGSVLGSAAGALALAVLANGLVFVGATPTLHKAVEGAIVLAAAVIAGWPKRHRLKVVK